VLKDFSGMQIQLQTHNLSPRPVQVCTFSNLTGLQTLFISMGSHYQQETIIRTFQSLDAFRDTNMTKLEIHGNNIETSFVLDGSILQYVQRICLKRFILSSMYITDISLQAFITLSLINKVVNVFGIYTVTLIPNLCIVFMSLLFTSYFTYDVSSLMSPILWLLSEYTHITICSKNLS
jgi:hypothetical protein